MQFIPHVTDEIKQWIYDVGSLPVEGTGKIPDIVMVELGGTVG